MRINPVNLEDLSYFMQIIIMRHGDAVYINSNRVLSEQGKLETKLTAIELMNDFHFTKIFSSPKTRALETASIVQSLMRGRVIPDIEVERELCPCGNAKIVRDYIEAVCDPNDTVLIVSHMPNIANIVSAFCPQATLPVFSTSVALSLESKNGVNFRSNKVYTPFSVGVSPNFISPKETMPTASFLNFQAYI